MEEKKPKPLVSVTEIPPPPPPQIKKNKSSLSSKKWESIPAASTEMCVTIWMSKINFEDSILISESVPCACTRQFCFSHFPYV